MRSEVCPRCGDPHPATQVVTDRLRAWDPTGYGQVFEVEFKEPICICPRCNMSWEGQDAMVAKERAYQAALSQRCEARV